jgi:hypothetical protein
MVAHATGCTRKVPALAPVQNAEPLLAKLLTRIPSSFCTAFSTAVVENSQPLGLQLKEK